MESPNKGIEMGFEKLALSKTTHAKRYAQDFKIGKIMVYLILFSSFFGVFFYFIAAKRNVNKPFWLAMGILFGPFALPFANHTFRESLYT